MRKHLTPAIAVCLPLMLSACAANTVAKKDAFPVMYQERPASILVLPPINETTAADAKEYYSTTLAEPLSYMGYYVFPIEVVTDVMQYEGAYDTENLMQVPPQKFREYLGADAVLFVRITKWDTAYYVIGGHVTVGVAFHLKSTTTGSELWKYEGMIRVDTGGGGGGGGLGGLIAQIVVTAIKTATTDYVPIAKRANAIVISTIPSGKYHPMHGQDQDIRVIQRK